MNNYKEIVTKAVIGKSKKTINNEYTLPIDFNIDNVLGCWVINHTFNGIINNDTVIVSGEYDINIWYSYESNTKTNVIIKNFKYELPIKINTKNNVNNPNNEVITRCLTQPSVTDVKLEIIGNTLLRINVLDNIEEYEEDIEEPIDTDYLK